MGFSFRIGVRLYPVHRVALEVAADGGIYGRKEGAFAKVGKEPEALELVSYGIFELGEAQLDSALVQSLVQFGEGIGSGDIDAGDRLRGDDQPARRDGRFYRRIENTLFEQLGIGKEQGRVPAEEDQAGYLARIRIPRDVVVAPDAFGTPQHRGVGTPAIPQKLDDRDDNRQTYAWDSAKNRDTHQADD